MSSAFNLKSTGDLIKIISLYEIYGYDIDHEIKEKWQVEFILLQCRSIVIMCNLGYGCA